MVENEAKEGLGCFNDGSVAIRICTLVNAGCSQEEIKEIVAREFGFTYQPGKDEHLGDDDE